METMLRSLEERIEDIEFNVVDDFAESSRGAGGFGSTGKH